MGGGGALFGRRGLVRACRPIGAVLALTGLLVLVTEIPWRLAKIVIGVALLAAGAHLLQQGR